MTRFSFLWALLLSVGLHGGLLGLPEIWPGLGPRPDSRLPARLEVRLQPQAEAHEAVLKNTWEDAAENIQAPVPSAPTSSSKPSLSRKSAAHQAHEVQVAQRKLSRHIYYPPVAINQGLEGEVRLLIKLAADGRFLAVSVAASSGFPVLDRAALDAAHAMGRLPDTGLKVLLLPVVFRLQ